MATPEPISEALYTSIQHRNAKTMREQIHLSHPEYDRNALLAEVERLHAAVPAWADLHDLLAAQRHDPKLSDAELTSAVMALLTGQGGTS